MDREGLMINFSHLVCLKYITINYETRLKQRLCLRRQGVGSLFKMSFKALVKHGES